MQRTTTTTLPLHMMLASSADDARRMYGSPARGNSLPRRTLEVTPSRTKCRFSRHSRRKLGDVTDYRPGRRLRTKGGERALSLGIWAGLGVAACAVCSALGNMTLAWIFVVVAPTGHTLFVQAQARRYNRIAAPGHLALTAGDAMTAQREFAEARAKVRWPGFLRRLGDYNRAFALIRQGQFAAANELLSDLDQRGGVLNLDGAIAGAFASRTHSRATSSSRKTGSPKPDTATASTGRVACASPRSRSRSRKPRSSFARARPRS